MRRIQIYIEEELDDVLQAKAAQSGRSKASLIRDCVAAHYSLTEVREDPITALVGSINAEPAEDIDEVIYGR